MRRIALALWTAALLSAALPAQVRNYQPVTLLKVERAANQIVIRKTMHATRADGSRAEATVDSEGHYTVRTITLAPARKTVVIHQDLHAVTTYYLSADRPIPASDDCTRRSPFWTKAGEETILGYRTIRFVNESEGGITSEHFVAPALNCSSLRDTVAFPNGARITQVESVILGEPDAGLFQIPEDYREMSPGAVETTRASALGVALPPSLAADLPRRDRAYRQSQRHKPAR